MGKKAKKALVCDDCGEPDNGENGVLELEGGHTLCEECEQSYVYCDACKDWHDEDGDTCRHVFWTDCGWAGAGSTTVEPETMKPGVQFVFDNIAVIEPEWKDKTPTQVLFEVYDALRRHQFRTFFYGPMIGSYGTMTLKKDTGADYSPDIASYHSGCWEPVKEKDADLFDDGWGWLQSLCCEETKKANKLTAAWLREVIDRRGLKRPRTPRATTKGE